MKIDSKVRCVTDTYSFVWHVHSEKWYLLTESIIVFFIFIFKFVIAISYASLDSFIA